MNAQNTERRIIVNLTTTVPGGQFDPSKGGNLNR